MKENHFCVFVASRFDPRLKLGAGSYLFLPTEELTNIKQNNVASLPFITKEFEKIAASDLELETTIWTLEYFLKEKKIAPIRFFSDFNSTKDLLARREKLELTNYAGSKPGTLIVHAEQHQRFFKLYDKLHFEMAWMWYSAEPLPVTDTQQALFTETVKRADTALKSRLKTENKVADKWF